METVSFFTFLEEKITEILFQLFFLALVAFLLIFYGVDMLFVVCGSDIRICDDELAEALKHLSERNRENLLMYYFLEMSDTEIAKRQNISRSGVFQNRHNSLELMKKILKEK